MKWAMGSDQSSVR